MSCFFYSATIKDLFLIATLCITSGITEQNIALVRLEPDPQQIMPCSWQRMQFQCQSMIPSATLTWILPTSEILEFSVIKNVGDIRNSSDNVYSATLTGKTEDDDPNTERFFFTSVLQILMTSNGSNLSCSAAGTETVKDTTTIIFSGEFNFMH
jgi:hypothetical protein